MHLQSVSAAAARQPAGNCSPAATSNQDPSTGLQSAEEAYRFRLISTIRRQRCGAAWDIVCAEMRQRHASLAHARLQPCSGVRQQVQRGFDVEQPETDCGEPHSGGGKPKAGGGEPKVNGGDLEVDGEEPKAGGGEPQADIGVGPGVGEQTRCRVRGSQNSCSSVAQHSIFNALHMLSCMQV